MICNTISNQVETIRNVKKNKSSERAGKGETGTGEAGRNGKKKFDQHFE